MNITMGLIVFDAIKYLPEGMLVKCLQNMYEHMFEIIVVEGAVKATTRAWDGDTTWATPDGHSTDDTLKVIREFPDPDNKIRIIESNGFWDGKPDQMNQYVHNAKGDYIWYVDGDEFYRQRDIILIKKLLDHLKPDCVQFFARHFFGDFHHCLGDEENRWGNDLAWQRIFRNEPGATWQRVEPPEYIFADGRRADAGHVLTREFMRDMDIRLYHYSYVSPQQIEFKSNFFQRPEYKEMWDGWHQDHDFPLIRGSKSTPFTGEHPEIIKEYL